MTHRLGLIINPIAGMGGSVGLKGTDGDLAAKAQAMGAAPVAGPRAVTALTQLSELRKELLVLTCSGDMGATAAETAGLNSRIVSGVGCAETTAEDTRTAANAILGHRPLLFLFVGGDGTARDVSEIVGKSIPILGVPSGVKMHSAVFAAISVPEGLAMKSAAPEDNPSMVMSALRELTPLTNTTMTRGWSRLMDLRTSIPFISGISISSRTMSGGNGLIFFSAMAPVGAVSTSVSIGMLFTAFVNIRRYRELSSTTRTLRG